MGYNKRTPKNAPHYPRRMLRLVIQTKRKYKKKNKGDLDGKDIRNDGMSEGTEEEDSTNDEYDEDSSISVENDPGSTSSQEGE